MVAIPSLSPRPKEQFDEPWGEGMQTLIGRDEAIVINIECCCNVSSPKNPTDEK